MQEKNRSNGRGTDVDSEGKYNRDANTGRNSETPKSINQRGPVYYFQTSLGHIVKKLLETILMLQCALNNEDIDSKISALCPSTNSMLEVSHSEVMLSEVLIRPAN